MFLMSWSVQWKSFCYGLSCHLNSHITSNPCFKFVPCCSKVYIPLCLLRWPLVELWRVRSVCSEYLFMFCNNMVKQHEKKKRKLHCLFCLALYIVILLPLAWVLKPFLIQDTCCCHLLLVLFSVIHSALLCGRLMRNSQMGLNLNL